MRITVRRLRRIIKEEVTRLLVESLTDVQKQFQLELQNKMSHLLNPDVIEQMKRYFKSGRKTDKLLSPQFNNLISIYDKQGMTNQDYIEVLSQADIISQGGGDRRIIGGMPAPPGFSL